MRRLLLLFAAVVLHVTLLPSATVAQSSSHAGLRAAQVVVPPAGHEPVPVEEMIDARTERSRTWLMSDGSYAVEVTMAPLHVPDSEGGWTPIDLSLDEADDGYAVAENAVDVSLPSDVVDRVEVDDGVEPVRFRLLEAEASATGSVEPSTESEAAAVSDTAVSYVEAVPGVDVVYEAQVSGVKETLLLDGPSSPTRFVYVVEAPGLVRMGPCATSNSSDSTCGWSHATAPPLPSVRQTLRRTSGRPTSWWTGSL